MKYNPRLNEWIDKYEASRSAYSSKVEECKRNQDQYDGLMQPEKGLKVPTLYNFTAELIESIIDSSIPQPKVDPNRPDPRTKELSQVIEDMIKGEIKRLRIDQVNDQDERITKIMGGDVLMIQWDNSVTTHDTVGAISVKLVSPIQFVPQEGMFEADEMDYMFLTFEDTKEHVEKMYGVDVSDETVDATRADTTTLDDTVTQVVAFFKNKQNGLGCFSWAGDTVLIDDQEYQARGDQICVKCGRTKPTGVNVCQCGSHQWEKRNMYDEVLLDDIVQSDGNVIPAMSPARDENGNYAMQDVEVPDTQTDMDPTSPTYLNDFPIMDRVFDDKMNIVGEQPRMKMEPQAYMEPTRIPYYTPKGFPVCVRRNVSKYQDIFGSSDVAIIRNLQMEANKVSYRMTDKVTNGGMLLTKPADLNFNFTNGRMVVEVDDASQISMIQARDVSFNPTGDVSVIIQLYEWARSTLGINDSSQGKPDSTAESGRAKETQISRAQGRQESKIRMKNKFYSEIYQMIFQYMLAYADEPRQYQTENVNGEMDESTFNRYDFLTQDENGNWYYLDEFTFTVDNQSGASDDRQTIIQNINDDFRSGLYGDAQDPETQLNVWKDRADVSYPGAKRQVARWQERLQQYQQMQQQMQQQAMMNPTGGGGGDMQQM